MANWRSHRETVHFLGGPNWGRFRHFGTTKIRRGVSRALDAKWHIPSPCLDAHTFWVSIEIYSINRASEWLWQYKPKNPSKRPKCVHGFQVRTPMCHIVPVSHAYGYMREIGALWQIGVLTGKRCSFLGPKWVIFRVLALQKQGETFDILSPRSMSFISPEGNSRGGGV